MKGSSYALVRFSRRLFGIGRVFCAVAIPLFCFGLLPTRFALPASVHETATVQFRTSGVVATPDLHPATAELRLKTVTGHVTINEKNAGSTELTQLNRRALLPRLLLAYLIGFVVCDLLWRLCRNIERNEVFTDTNLKLVRLLAVIVAIGEPLADVLRRWTDFRLSEFAVGHVAFTGLTVEPPRFDLLDAVLAALAGNIGALLTGLLVFVTAEVFRHGLLLKQESDLTV